MVLGPLLRAATTMLPIQHSELWLIMDLTRSALKTIAMGKLVFYVCLLKLTKSHFSNSKILSGP